MNEVPETEPLLDLAALTAYLGVAPATVYSWRYTRSGPPAIKIGKHLRWRRRDVEAWLAAHSDAHD